MNREVNQRSDLGSISYCGKCKQIFLKADGQRCECGGKFSRKFDIDSPVEIVRVNSAQRNDVERILSKAEIPYSVSEDSGYSPAIGKISGGAALLVPLCFVKKAAHALGDGGLISEPGKYDDIGLPDDPENEWEEMPEGKARVIRVLAILGFLVLIYLCVAGVDLIAAWFGGIGAG